ncbi:MAG: hypothetical protein OTJ97_07280 [SAR202 cluster bacterium]|nr:hypothetical protein [SAR202 cluster bacterium]
MAGRIWSVHTLAKGETSDVSPFIYSPFGLGAVATVTLALSILEINRVADVHRGAAMMWSLREWRWG